ncbi:hypothetical protein MCHI_001980 [Candidatus Magnetoovum chiemensis]|nr:hypothetical protein MCHI_001980 [Candidatus Magnetoovum chiemensis]
MNDSLISSRCFCVRVLVIVLIPTRTKFSTLPLPIARKNIPTPSLYSISLSPAVSTAIFVRRSLSRNRGKSLPLPSFMDMFT